MVLLLLCSCNDSRKNSSLTVYCYGNYGVMDSFNEAKIIFKSRFPDVDFIEYDLKEESTQVAYDDIQKKLQTELMSGRGPDLLIQSPDGMYKQMKAGAFASIDDFMICDTEFNDYNFSQMMLSCGKYRNRQYILPLYYAIPVLISTSQILETYQIDSDNLKTLDGYCTELNRCLGLYPNIYIYRNPQTISFPLETDLFMQFPNLLNYEDSFIDINVEFEQTMELNRKIYQHHMEHNFLNTYSFELNNTLFVQGYLTSGEPIGAPAVSFYGDPFITVLPNNSDGGTALIELAAAITSTSKNKNLAWEFLKLFIWRSGENGKCGIPVAQQYMSIFLRENKRSLTALGAGSAKIQTGSGLLQFGVPPASFFDLLEGTIIESTSAVVLDKDPYRLITDFFIPYYKGENSLDECSRNARETFFIYNSE